MAKAPKKKSSARRVKPSRAGYVFPKKRAKAAFYDGDLVGLRGPDGAVLPKTAPRWFPTPTQVVVDLPTSLKPRQVVIRYGSLFIGTRAGVLEAAPGDWIVRMANGEIAPMKPDVFEATFGKVKP